MSNRTDYANVAIELRTGRLRSDVEKELHNAHVAGAEGSRCGCTSCGNRARVVEEWVAIVEGASGRAEEHVFDNEEPAKTLAQASDRSGRWFRRVTHNRRPG